MRINEDVVKVAGSIWRELHSSLWHTTHPERFLSILESRAILPEPDIPNEERWGTACGQESYPFVRSIGGISLFDFSAFEPEAYQAAYPLSTWQEFVPFRMKWGGRVWIEIASENVSSNLIPGRELVERWRQGFLGHNIMPLIEVAHIGPLPITSIKRVLFVLGDGSRKNCEIHEFGFPRVDRIRYDQLAGRCREAAAKWVSACECPLSMLLG